MLIYYTITKTSYANLLKRFLDSKWHNFSLNDCPKFVQFLRSTSIYLRLPKFDSITIFIEFYRINISLYDLMYSSYNFHIIYSRKKHDFIKFDIRVLPMNPIFFGHIQPGNFPRKKKKKTGDIIRCSI